MASFAQLTASEGAPASVHIEVAVLGAMLLDGVAITDATATLKADDFSLDSHQRVYRCIIDLMGVGRGVDTLTVQEELIRRRELESIGGPAYLAFLTEGIPRNFNIESYVRIVKDKSLLRQLMSIFHDGGIRASDQSEEAITVLSDVEAKLADVADSAIQRGFSGIGEIVASSFGSIDALYEQGREITGLATHYVEFDRMTSGLQDSELIIIAARPSMGKTAWAINIAQNAAVKDGKVVAVFSLEMIEGEPAAPHARQRSSRQLAQHSDGLPAQVREGQAARRARTPDGLEALHRRHARHHARRDARQGPPSAPAGGPPRPHRHRLPAAHDRLHRQRTRRSSRTARRRSPPSRAASRRSPKR